MWLVILQRIFVELWTSRATNIHKTERFILHLIYFMVTSHIQNTNVWQKTDTDNQPYRLFPPLLWGLFFSQKGQESRSEKDLQAHTLVATTCNSSCLKLSYLCQNDKTCHCHMNVTDVAPPFSSRFLFFVLFCFVQGTVRNLRTRPKLACSQTALVSLRGWGWGSRFPRKRPDQLSTPQPTPSTHRVRHRLQVSYYG